MGTGKLRHQQPAAALIPNQAAENGVRHARHRRQDSRRADGSSSN
jgi:hypothetical protein